MSQLNNRLLTVAIVLFIITTVASNGAVRTVAQSVSEVIVKNTTSNPVPVKSIGTTAVKVNNPATTPVWVQDVNEARQPIQKTILVSMPNGQEFKSKDMYVVPFGKRLVIEYVSGKSNVPDTQGILSVAIYTKVSGGSSPHFVDLTWQGGYGGRSHFTTGEMVRLYADAGTTVSTDFMRTGNTDEAIWYVTFSGYLVDVP
jgi:hypothetical protein